MSDFSFSARDRVRPKTKSTIPVLLISAIGALALTCAGGIVVWTNTQRSSEAHDWLDHSYRVLTTVQSESQSLDRIDFAIQMYKAKGAAHDLLSAQAATAGMQAGVLHLQKIVLDNASQERHAGQLEAVVQRLYGALDSVRKFKVDPEREIGEAREILLTIRDEERDLLQQRADDSQRNSLRSLPVQGAFLGFSMIVVIVLFGILIREAMLRRTFEQELSSTIETLERRGGESVLLKSASDELQICLTSADAQKCAARYLQELVPGSSGATFMFDDSRSELESAIKWNNPAPVADNFSADTCCGLRTGRLRWRRPGNSEIDCSHFCGTPPANYVCIPLAAHGETLGFVYLSCPTNEIAGLAHSRNSLIQAMVELASMSIAGLNLRAKLEREAIRDGLTGLFNRRFMEIALDRELHRASRRNVPVAVLMMDVDHFKLFNDTYGHEAGDVVLRQVAKLFSQSVRTEDIICRYGGEEFVIILPELDEVQSLERAEKIRRNVGELHFQFKGQTLRHISISVGVAMYPYPAGDVADLLRLADKALYEAKRAGRNQVHLGVEPVAVTLSGTEHGGDEEHCRFAEMSDRRGGS